jgi:hypothetical protein
MFDTSNRATVVVVVGKKVVRRDIRDEVIEQMVTHDSADTPSTLHT